MNCHGHPKTSWQLVLHFTKARRRGEAPGDLRQNITAPRLSARKPVSVASLTTFGTHAVCSEVVVQEMGTIIGHEGPPHATPLALVTAHGHHPKKHAPQGRWAGTVTWRKRDRHATLPLYVRCSIPQSRFRSPRLSRPCSSL
ncbi:Putative protein of unknown function [Podospora comata]|uniref:Uncharacterized protein n=1 Tax=Podospora comata TaxID=48703 RepID=A0ABY6RSX7_PODCO|nr:Putative protein of unknown function [Podospora comata]